MQTLISIIGGLALVVSSIAGFTANTVTYTAVAVAPTVAHAAAREPETIVQKIDRISAEVGIASSTLYNLAFSESTLGQNRTGDGGKSCGVVHFNRDYYPVENSRCDDDDYILTRAAQMIKAGLAYRFSPCSCIATARNLGVSLPIGVDAADLRPNTKLVDLAPGDLVLFKYKNGLSHVAVYQGLSNGLLDVKEGNYTPCRAPTERLVDPSDHTVVGYWHSAE